MTQKVIKPSTASVFVLKSKEQHVLNAVCEGTLRSKRRVFHQQTHPEQFFPSRFNVEFKAPDAFQRSDRKELFRVSPRIHEISVGARRNNSYRLLVINCVNSAVNFELENNKFFDNEKQIRL